ncbi:MAG: TlpA family protein disulfide reductase [Elusimicrobiota bacterium]|jgi:thiol-disulfide isomerase/thioredoxin|nr:TlpA family protein disulfide reductase [Elusimicrobiota bacterium]
MRKLLVICLAVLALAACGGDKADMQSAQPVTAAAGDIIPKLDGSAWDFNVASENPVLVSFLAVDCDSCKKMAPLVDKFARNYKGKKVEVVLAYIDKDRAAVQEAARGLNLKNATIIYDAGEFAASLNVEVYPNTFLLNMAANTAITWVGFNETFPKSFAYNIDKLK